MASRNRLNRIANRLATLAANQGNPVARLTDAELDEGIRVLEKEMAGHALTAEERRRLAVIHSLPIPQRFADMSDEEVEAEIARLKALGGHPDNQPEGQA